MNGFYNSFLFCDDTVWEIEHTSCTETHGIKTLLICTLNFCSETDICTLSVSSKLHDEVEDMYLNSKTIKTI